MNAADTTRSPARFGERLTVTASRFSEEQWAWGGLGVAMAISAAVLLWAGRHATLFADELTFLQYFRSFDPTSLLTPHNAHLILIPRIIYAAVFQTVGPSHAALAAVELVGVLLCAGLVFVLAKRRVSPLVALALTLPLLFFGSSWDVVLSSLGIPFVYSVALGLGALVALERGDARGDVAACALLVASLASHSFGLAFLLGAAVAVLVSADRWRRAWLVVIPLLAYSAWWTWALHFHQASIEQPSNILLIPNFVADSLAAVTGSIAGLNYPIGSSDPITTPIDTSWGHVLAVVALAALAWRLRRSRPTASFWVLIAVPLAFWVLIAIEASPARTPEQTRFLYPGAVLVLVVVAEALRGVRFSQRGLLALFAGVALALGANLKILDDASAHLADFSAKARSELAMVELARQQVDPKLRLSDASRDLRDPTNFPVFAGPYLAAADDVGSLAFSLHQVAQEPEEVREDADFTLTRSLALEVQPAQQPPSAQGCSQERQTSGTAVVFQLPPDGGVIGLTGAPPAQMALRRFGDQFGAPLNMPPGAKWLTLRVPSDSSPLPWYGAISTPAPVTVCPLSS